MKVELGKFVPAECDLSQNKDSYCDLFEQVCRKRYGDATYLKYWSTVKDWLDSTDVFEAPASTCFHEPYPGGLVQHTLRVYNNMLELFKCAPWESCDIASATLCALTHDWCKIGLYVQDWRNVKNAETGQWEKVPCYKKSEPLMPLGHGVASLIMARKFFNLNTEEMLTIRWHMGSYHCSQEDRNELHAAMESYPMVLLLQTADMMAITKYSV